MKLLDPSPGEVIDRLTILHLKIVHGTYRSANVGHFKHEAMLLQQRLFQLGSQQSTVTELAVQLAAVNAALWQASDAMEGGIDHGRAIFDWNKQRATLVQQINTEIGVDLPPEKL